SRLPLQASLLGDDPVDPDIKQFEAAARPQDRFGILAGGDQGNANAGPLQRIDEGDRRLEDLDPTLAEGGLKLLVLGVADTADRIPLRRVRRGAERETDAPRFEEAGDTVISGLPVDIAAVVGPGIERCRFTAGLPSPLIQEGIEDPPPGVGVNARGPRDNSIHVEDDGVIALRVEDMVAWR